MRSGAVEELGLAWDAVADWATYVLMREGLESVALGPLAGHTRAAEWIVRRESRSDVLKRRQLAAMLVGHMTGDSGSDADLLAELFEREVRRIREGRHEDEASARAEMVDAAVVVSSIVDSAAMWARIRRLRAAGLEVLRRVVESALAGEAWTNLERAAMTLARRGGREEHNLIARLQRLLAVNGDQTGARLMERLLTGDTSMADDDEATLTYGQRAASEFQVAGEAREAMDRLMEAAEAMERVRA